MKVKSPLKFHGGKQPLAAKIVALLPPHTNYCEPYAGGLAVLFAKEPRGTSEVVNDINSGLTNFYCVLRDERQFNFFVRQCEATPFCEYQWERARAILAAPWGDYSDVDCAWAFFVCCRQSLAGRMQSFAPISTSRLRRGQNEQTSAWWSAVEGLGAVHERLKRVVILNRDGVDVIKQFDKPDTVQYIDCPYYPTTRAAPDVYAHEMTVEQHTELLDTVLTLKHAKVAISGYRCEKYDDKLKDWRRVDWDCANHAAGGRKKKVMVESLWTNYGEQQ